MSTHKKQGKYLLVIQTLTFLIFHCGYTNVSSLLYFNVNSELLFIASLCKKPSLSLLRYMKV